MNDATQTKAPGPVTLKYLAMLRDLRPGQRSYHVAKGVTAAILFGRCVEMGLARTVKHRDRTRSYVLTDAGRAVLAAPPAIEPPSDDVLKDLGAWP
jgi:hypothetical protein